MDKNVNNNVSHIFQKYTDSKLRGGIRKGTSL